MNVVRIFLLTPPPLIYGEILLELSFMLSTEPHVSIWQPSLFPDYGEIIPWQVKISQARIMGFLTLE